MFQGADVQAQTPTAMDSYRKLTAVAIRCGGQQAANQILVCGRRAADRYRLPLVIKEAGNPRDETMWGERVRLQHQTTTCEDLGPFLIGCGKAGLSVSTNFGGKDVQFRKLAD